MPPVIHDINEPIPDPSSLLAQRLDNWIHCLNILYDYVDTYTTLTKKSIQSYEKIKKSISTLPKFTRYENTFNKPEPEGGFINVAKNGPKIGNRTSTMGSSEIVLGALSRSNTASATGSGGGATAGSATSTTVPKSASGSVESTSTVPGAPPAYPESAVPNGATEPGSPDDPHNKGIDGLFEMLRLRNDLNLASFQNLDKQIRDQILPVFKELINEAAAHKKKFNNIIDKNNKITAKLAKSKTKIINDLESSITIYNNYSITGPLKSSNGTVLDNSIDYEKDPFLVKKTFFKNLHEQFQNENQLVESLINLKEEIFAFELKIIAHIKKLVVLFNNFQISNYEELTANFLYVSKEFSLFDENFEIEKFLLNNINKNDDQLLVLLSSKLPNDHKLVDETLKKDIHFTKVEDEKLYNTINHDATVPLIRQLIHYQEIKKLTAIKDKFHKPSSQPSSVKNDYFALTKMKYLFVYGTDNEILPVGGTAPSDASNSRLLTSVDSEFLKGSLEPSLIFYLPTCRVIEDFDEKDLMKTNEADMSRSKSIKSKFGSIKKRLTSAEEKPNPNEYTIKFVGVDLNHRLLSKISKTAHKRTIVMKFSNKEQYQIWNNLIREMSGDLEELAEDYDEKISLKDTSNNGLNHEEQEVDYEDVLSQNSKDLMSDFQRKLTLNSVAVSTTSAAATAAGYTTASENGSDPNVDSFDDLKEAIKKDKAAKDTASAEAVPAETTTVEKPVSSASEDVPAVETEKIVKV